MQHEREVRDALFCGTDRRILTLEFGGRASLWALDGALVKALDHPVAGAVCAPGGQQFATWDSDGVIRTWDAMKGVAKGSPITTPEGKDLDDGLRWSPNAEYVVAWGHGTIRAWLVGNGQALGPTMTQEFVQGAAFDPAATKIMSWDFKTVRMWDPRTGQAVGRPLSHEGLLGEPEFSADGQRILTRSEDGTVRLWNAANSQCIAVLHHKGRVVAAAFSPDETRILSASEEGPARLWDISFDESIPLEMWALDFEVRSGTSLGADGQVRVLTLDEWNAKSAELSAYRQRRSDIKGRRPADPQSSPSR